MFVKLRAFVAGDRLLATLFLVVSLVYGWNATSMKPELAADVVGPGMFPESLAILGIILALLHLARPPSSAPLSGRAVKAEIAALRPLALLLAYAFALEWLGFALSTAAFLVAMFKYLGEPKWRTAVLAAVVITAVFVVLFQVIFGMTLPQGVVLPRLW